MSALAAKILEAAIAAAEQALVDHLVERLAPEISAMVTKHFLECVDFNQAIDPGRLRKR